MAIASEMASRVFTAPVFEEVASLLDGTRSADAVVEALPARDAAEVYYAIRSLHRAGLLLEDGASWEPPAAKLPDAAGEDVPAALAALPGPLRLTVLGHVPEPEVGEELTRLGATLSDPSVIGHPGGWGGVRLVLTDDYLHPDLQGINEAALSSGERWFLAKPVGSAPWSGPWFVPGSGPCWACLGQRILRNRPLHRFLAARAEDGNVPSLPAPWSPRSLRAGLLSALALLGETAVPPRVWTLSADAPPVPHPVVRRPQCASCGDPGLTARTQAEPVRLRACPKRFTLDGGHRTWDPEGTVTRLQELVSPVSGVVDRLARTRIPGWEDPPGSSPLAPPPRPGGAAGITEGAGEPDPPRESAGTGIHLFVAGGNQAGPSPDLGHFRRGLRTWSGGKGVTEVQARASALGEAVERYSGVFQGDEPRRRTTLSELGSEGIHPNRWMLFSEAQYRDRAAWNAHPSPYARVPQPFEPDAVMEWTPVWSLTHKTHRYLPTASLFYRYGSEGTSMCIADSNGCASGNTLEEAIVQGFLELVERDAVALWWYNRIRRPEVDLEALEHSYPRRLWRRYRERGRDLRVLDLTTDLGIPCCAAVSRRPEGPREEILLGLGAHFDPAIAVTRAVTEVNQMLSAVLASGSKVGEEPVATWLREATLEEHSHLVPLDGPASDPTSRARLDTDDLREDVQVCRRIVEGMGMEFLVHNQTRPDIGVPVVRVIVPGLRHFRPRFFPGRLYDVPVFLRWAQRSRDEREMNPIPFFL